ncbi:MAG: CHAD domain-containing protein [Magnetococcales bacterium]|nr:CHAD domain-containing protein [Magnetococcales bacterium]
MSQSPVLAEHSVDDAFQAILKANYAYMETWLDNAYHRETIRGVHQTRVSFRRMRSALSVFRKAIPREAVQKMGDEMKWFASELGPARDSDVFIDEGLGDKNIKGKIGPAAGEAKMLALTEAKNAEAYIKVRAAIDDPRFAQFRKDFTEWVDSKGWRNDMSPKMVKRLDKNITGFAVKVMTKRFNKILAAGDDLGVLPDYELHELRIQCKKLRYSIEFFSGLFDADEMAEFTARFKAVQRQLGIINDVAVMPGLLEWVLGDSDDAEVKEFADGVAKLRWEQQGVAKSKLPGLWTDLGATKIPWA